MIHPRQPPLWRQVSLMTAGLFLIVLHLLAVEGNNLRSLGVWISNFDSDLMNVDVTLFAAELRTADGMVSSYTVEERNEDGDLLADNKIFDFVFNDESYSVMTDWITNPTGSSTGGVIAYTAITRNIDLEAFSEGTYSLEVSKCCRPGGQDTAEAKILFTLFTQNNYAPALPRFLSIQPLYVMAWRNASANVLVEADLNDASTCVKKPNEDIPSLVGSENEAVYDLVQVSSVDGGCMVALDTTSSVSGINTGVMVPVGLYLKVEGTIVAALDILIVTVAPPTPFVLKSFVELSFPKAGEITQLAAGITHGRSLISVEAVKTLFAETIIANLAAQFPGSSSWFLSSGGAPNTGRMTIRDFNFAANVIQVTYTIDVPETDFGVGSTGFDAITSALRSPSIFTGSLTNALGAVTVNFVSYVCPAFSAGFCVHGEDIPTKKSVDDDDVSIAVGVSLGVGLALMAAIGFAVKYWIYDRKHPERGNHQVIDVVAP